MNDLEVAVVGDDVVEFVHTVTQHFRKIRPVKNPVPHPDVLLDKHVDLPHLLPPAAAEHLQQEVLVRRSVLLAPGNVDHLVDAELAPEEADAELGSNTFTRVN